VFLIRVDGARQLLGRAYQWDTGAIQLRWQADAMGANVEAGVIEWAELPADEAERE
jgi:hypothetical protein